MQCKRLVKRIFWAYEAVIEENRWCFWVLVLGLYPNLLQLKVMGPFSTKLNQLLTLLTEMQLVLICLDDAHVYSSSASLFVRKLRSIQTLISKFSSCSQYMSTFCTLWSMCLSYKTIWLFDCTYIVFCIFECWLSSYCKNTITVSWKIEIVKIFEFISYGQFWFFYFNLFYKYQSSFILVFNNL